MCMSCADAQAISIERLDNLSGQYRLELFDVGVLLPNIAKYISATAYYSQIFAFQHNISFNLFRRSRMRSTSFFGVLMPWVNFF